jgi:hypothetical protein
MQELLLDLVLNGSALIQNMAMLTVGKPEN